MKRVDIYLMEDGNDKIVGRITWDGQSIKCEPNSTLLKCIAEQAIPELKTGKMLYPDKEPEKFLDNLKFQYRSAYLRASEAKVIDGGDGWQERGKALSALNETTGGALVPPPKGRERNMLRKSTLLYGVKLHPPSAQGRGFTGKKRDRLGRNMCFQQGSRVPCDSASGPPSKPVESAPHREAEQGGVTKPGGMTSEAAEIYDRYFQGHAKWSFEKLGFDAQQQIKAIVNGIAHKAKELAGALWDRMTPEEQTACKVAGSVVMAVEHHLNSPAKATQAMVDEIAKARGFDKEQQKSLRTTIRAIDAALANTINIPLVHQGLEEAGVPEALGGETIGAIGTFLAAKVGYYTPVASAAYILLSAVKNPLATMRAAKALIGKVKYSFGHGVSFGDEGHAHKSYSRPILTLGEAVQWARRGASNG
jgi:hypothetical protein